MRGLEVRREDSPARVLDGRHHAIASDGDDPVHFLEGDLLLPQLPFLVGQQRLDDVPDERLVLRAGRLDRLSHVHAPDDHVGGGLNLLHLVDVVRLLVPGEVEDSASGLAHRLADREEDGVPQPSAEKKDRLGLLGDLGRRARRPHDDDRIAGPERADETRGDADLQGDHREEPLFAIDPGAREGEAFHREGRALQPVRVPLVVLETEELPRLEPVSLEWSFDRHFDDLRRQAFHLHDPRPEAGLERVEQVRKRRVARGLVLGVETGGLLLEEADDIVVPVAGRRHRADDVPRVHRVVVAVVGDELPVLRVRSEDGRLRRVVGHRLDPPRSPFVHETMPLEELLLTVHRERSGELLLVDDVRRRSRGDETGPRGEREDLARSPELSVHVFLPLERHLLEGPVPVGERLHGVHVLDEDDAFFEALDDLLVVQAVGGRLGHRPAVEDPDAAPLPDQGDEVRRLPCPGRAGALRPDLPAVRKELVQENLLLLGVERFQNGLLAQLPRERFVPVEDLLDLLGIVGDELRRHVDRREPPADDDGRQAHLEVGHRFALGRARELEGHEEVRSLPDAADQVVLDLDDRRPAGPRRDGDVVEPELPGVVRRERPAEARPAEDAERSPPHERDVDDAQEVLVPPDGDPVLGDAAETGQDTRVQLPFDLLPPVPDGAGRGLVVADEVGGERLDLESVHAHDAEPLVQEELRERISCRSHPDDEDVLAVVRKGVGALDVERVPPREQAVDLEPPRKIEDIGQNARLSLRDVDRLLLLVDAGLHAVVADPVARAGDHRIVDRDHREGGDRIALFLEPVGLGNLLPERTAVEDDPDGVLDPRPLLVDVPLTAGVFVPVVAEDAVIDLGERLLPVEPAVRELEAVAAPSRLRRAFHRLGHSGIGPVELDQAGEVHLLGRVERDPPLDLFPARRVLRRGVGPAFDQLHEAAQEHLLLVRGLGGGLDEAGEEMFRLGVLTELSADLGKPFPGASGVVLELLGLADEFPLDGEKRADHAAGRDLLVLIGRLGREDSALEGRGHLVEGAEVHLGGIGRLVLLQDAAEDKVVLEGEEKAEPADLLAETSRAFFYAEEADDKAVEVDSHPAEEIGRFRRGDALALLLPVSVKGGEQLGVGLLHVRVEKIGKLLKLRRLIEVGVGEAGDSKLERGSVLCRWCSVHRSGLSLGWRLAASRKREPPRSVRGANGGMKTGHL